MIDYNIIPKNTLVSITHVGQQYSGYEEMARKLGLDKYQEYHSVGANGDLGIIMDSAINPQDQNITIYGVQLDSGLQGLFNQNGIKAEAPHGVAFREGDFARIHADKEWRSWHGYMDEYIETVTTVCEVSGPRYYRGINAMDVLLQSGLEGGHLFRAGFCSRVLDVKTTPLIFLDGDVIVFEDTGLSIGNRKVPNETLIAIAERQGLL
jgi:hypothetical protein